MELFFFLKYIYIYYILVRKLLERMDKILYFRSSPDPLILDEEQREIRRKGILKQNTD